SSHSFHTQSIDILFFCARWCCQPDCCQINSSVWLLIFFSIFFLFVYLIYFCANDYRRRDLMRRIFKNYRPVRRSNAVREKKVSTNQQRWKDAPRISIDPPTPSITVITEREGETTFNFADSDIVL
ncbi:hypothetical protein PFISCL1PPCAC_791, partial [Pristionchus fissidentatus]